MSESRFESTTSRKRKQKIRWPPNNNKAYWEKFDFDVYSILNTSLARGIDKKVGAMTTIRYNVEKGEIRCGRGPAEKAAISWVQI